MSYDPLAPLISAQIGYCPTCWAAVPTLKQRQHAQWHDNHAEPYGELLPLPTLTEIDQALIDRVSEALS
jgi:hypothetical protein